jgi:hypothetical protein
MYVNEWMSYACSDEGTYSHNIHDSYAHSHPSEEENLTQEIAAEFASVNRPSHVLVHLGGRAHAMKVKDLKAPLLNGYIQLSWRVRATNYSLKSLWGKPLIEVEDSLIGV